MQTVIIVIHLMVVLALVGVVLVQRSEGGGLGIGGGSGFMTARGAANALTRATAILAAAFFVTSLGLSILARYGGQPGDILDRVQTQQGGSGQGGVLDQLGGASTTPAPATPTTPTAPSSEQAPAQPAPAETNPTPPNTDGAPVAPASDPTAPAESSPLGATPTPSTTAPSTTTPAQTDEAPTTAPATPAQPAAPQVPSGQ